MDDTSLTIDTGLPIDPVSIVTQGTYAALKIKPIFPPKPKGGKRAEIIEFTSAARLRLMKRFHQIDWQRAKQALFVTLTYPDDRAESNLAERNAHKKEFKRLIEALTGKPLGAVWRCEWEPRKSGALQGRFAPHFHLLIFNHQFIHYEDINDCWRRAIRWTGYCRTEIGRMRKSSSIRLYLAKYISKEAISPSLVYAAYGETLGKAYGWLRPEAIPMCPVREYTTLTAGQIRLLMSLAGEQLPWLSKAPVQSWTALGALAQDVDRILRGERLDGLPET
jgi:hypothetical protein